MSKTKAEVRNRAATELGLLRLGQTLQNQDSVRITDAYEEVYARLKELGLTSWASTDSVPAEIVPYMVWLVAQSCVGTYGVSGERFNRILLNAGDDGEKAIFKIRQLITPKFESQSEADDF